jgi:Transglycosylase
MMSAEDLPSRPDASLLSRGKLAWAIALVVVSAGIAGGIFFARSSETYLQHRIAFELQKATGMKARVGALSLSADRGTLENIRLTGDGREIRIRTLEVDTDLKLLIAGHTACVDHAVIDRIDIVLNEGIAHATTEMSPASARPSPRTTVEKLMSTVDGATNGLRRFLAPEGRVDVGEIVVLAASEGAPPIQALHARAASISRHEDDFVASAVATLGDGTAGRLAGSLRFGATATAPKGRIDIEDARLSALFAFLPELPWYRPDRTRIGGTVELELPEETSSAVRLVANITVTNAAFYAPYIAETPVVLDLALSGKASWSHDMVSVDSGTVRLGRGSFGVSGRLSWGNAYRLDVKARMPRQDCNDAMSIVPDAVLGELSRFEWSGEIGAEARLRVDSSDPDSTLVEVHLDNLCRFERVPSVADTSRFERVFVHKVTDDTGQAFAFETGPGSTDWVSISEVSPFLIHAVLAHEDATFFDHAGFSTFAIESALKRNVEEGRMAFGASTISMQLAKNLFLTRDKTLARKAKEVFLTWWLESSLSKTEILELYLNVIEYGPGIYGLRRASRTYFDRDPADLTPGESSFLASLLPAPRAYFQQFTRGKLSAGAKQQMAFLLRHMRARNRIDDQALRYGLDEVEPMDGGGAFFGGATSLSANVGSAALLPFTASTPFSRESRLWWSRSESEHD